MVGRRSPDRSRGAVRDLRPAEFKEKNRPGFVREAGPVLVVS